MAITVTEKTKMYDTPEKGTLDESYGLPLQNPDAPNSWYWQQIATILNALRAEFTQIKGVAVSGTNPVSPKVGDIWFFSTEGSYPYFGTPVTKGEVGYFVKGASSWTKKLIVDITSYGFSKIKGAALSQTNPGSSEEGDIYFYSSKGTYPYFGTPVTRQNEIGFFKKGASSWDKVPFAALFTYGIQDGETGISLETLLDDISTYSSTTSKFKVRGESLKDASVQLSSFSQAVLDYIGSGGAVTNQPDERHLDKFTEGTEKLRIKDGFEGKTYLYNPSQYATSADLKTAVESLVAGGNKHLVISDNVDGGGLTWDFSFAPNCKIEIANGAVLSNVTINRNYTAIIANDEDVLSNVILTGTDYQYEGEVKYSNSQGRIALDLNDAVVGRYRPRLKNVSVDTAAARAAEIQSVISAGRIIDIYGNWDVTGQNIDFSSAAGCTLNIEGKIIGANIIFNETNIIDKQSQVFESCTFSGTLNCDVNPLWTGCRNDGITNDTSDFIKALTLLKLTKSNVLNASGEFLLDPITYDSSIHFAKPVRFIRNGSGTLFSITGSVGSDVDLYADAPKGAPSVKIATLPQGLERGALVKLESDQKINDHLNPGDADYMSTIGEQHIVREVISETGYYTIVFSSNLYDSFTLADNAILTVVNPVTVTTTPGFFMSTNSADILNYGLKITYGKDCVINGAALNIRGRSFQTVRGYNNQFNVSVYNADIETPGYGVAISSCDTLARVSGNFVNVRHAVSIGSTSTFSGGKIWEAKITNAHSTTFNSAPFECHHPCGSVYYENVSARGISTRFASKDLKDWSTGETYDEDEEVMYLGFCYKSKVASNTGNLPSGDYVNWENVTMVDDNNFRTALFSFRSGKIHVNDSYGSNLYSLITILDKSKLSLNVSNVTGYNIENSGIETVLHESESTTNRGILFRSFHLDNIKIFNDSVGYRYFKALKSKLTNTHFENGKVNGLYVKNGASLDISLYNSDNITFSNVFCDLRVQDSGSSSIGANIIPRENLDKIELNGFFAHNFAIGLYINDTLGSFDVTDLNLNRFDVTEIATFAIRTDQNISSFLINGASFKNASSPAAGIRIVSKTVNTLSLTSVKSNYSTFLYDDVEKLMVSSSPDMVNIYRSSAPPTLLIKKGTFIAPELSSGNGSPESIVTANVDAKYFDYTNSRHYKKMSGSGSTGWQIQPHEGRDPATTGNVNPIKYNLAKRNISGTVTLEGIPTDATAKGLEGHSIVITSDAVASVPALASLLVASGYTFVYSDACMYPGVGGSPALNTGKGIRLSIEFDEVDPGNTITVNVTLIQGIA